MLECLQPDIEPAWSEIAEMLRRTFQASHCIITLHYESGVHETLATAGLDIDWESKYEARFAGLNPFVSEALRRRPGGGDPVVAAGDNLVPFDQLKQLPFFKDFFGPLGINDSVGILMFDPVKPLGHISMRRTSAALRYGEAEEARLRSIADILAAALLRSRQLRILEARAAAFERLNVDNGGGLIVFDERGAVIDVEGTGRRLLDHFKTELQATVSEFRADPKKTNHIIPRESSEESATPAASTETAGEPPVFKKLPGRDLPGPFSLEMRRSAIEGRARLLCIIQERKKRGSPANFELPSQIHFTPRECDVVKLLAQGLDNLSIANSLKIGLYTTKDHIKAIFRKLHVRTRAEAVAVLARGGDTHHAAWR